MQQARDKLSNPSEQDETLRFQFDGFDKEHMNKYFTRKKQPVDLTLQLLAFENVNKQIQIHI